MLVLLFSCNCLIFFPSSLFLSYLHLGMLCVVLLFTFSKPSDVNLLYYLLSYKYTIVVVLLPFMFHTMEKICKQIYFGILQCLKRAILFFSAPSISRVLHLS